jgi:protease IV
MSQPRALTANFVSNNKQQQGMNPFSTIKKLFTAREGESTTFLTTVGLTAGGATLFAMPSIASAIYQHTTWPIYVARGIAIGAVLGIAWIIYNRLTMPVPAKDLLIKEGKITEVNGYAALVKISDLIEEDAADNIIPLLTKAFKDNESKGVLIKINSRGGSPVQAANIYKEILNLKDKYKKKVIVVGEDYLTSAAYYIAASADKIYVNANTITGSIGVISTSYGVHVLAEKMGIESRVFTAGENKHRLDMFKPVEEDDKLKIHNTLSELHDDFIDAVKQTRKDKLKGDEALLFSGDHWTGKKALELGLVDELGSLSSALEKEFNVVEFKEYKSSDWLNFNFGKILKKGITAAVVESGVSESFRYRI